MIFFKRSKTLNSLQESRLFDETSFYPRFIKDLMNCNEQVIIECPFIAHSRMEILTPIFKKIIAKGVKTQIITRHPSDYDESFRYYATEEILKCSELGVNIILERGNHHRKLAIIDKNILWEGSLNILSQNHSKEVMRRTNRKESVLEMISFLNLDKII